MSSSSKPAPRQVHVSPCVHAHWERDGRHRFELGFLVGQSDLSSSSSRPQQDLVLAAVEVPSEAPDLDHDVEVVQGFEDLSIDWVKEIAKQVDRLLPGGLELLGLYVVSSADPRAAIDQASVYLRAIASALTLPMEYTTTTTAEQHHHCIVHICSKTSKKSVKSFANLSDVTRTSALTAELTSPSTCKSLRLAKYTTRVAVDERVVYSQLSAHTHRGETAVVEIAEKRIDELQQQLQPLAQRIWRARGVAVANGDDDGGPQEIELLSPSAVSVGATDPSASEKLVGGRCCGVVACVAFVPANGPHAIELATYYLKMDFIKSLSLRVELLLERLSEDGAAGDVASMLSEGGTVSLPKRGLMTWRSGATQSPDQPLALSFHAFADDDELLAVQNALEILSAGDELSGIDIDTVATSLQWLEEETEEEAAANLMSVAFEGGGVTTTTTTETSMLSFLIIPLLLVVVAYVVTRQSM